MSEYQLFRLVVAAVIYNHEGKFLIAQRDKRDPHQPGVWAIPAGHVEVFKSDIETFDYNLKREVREEIGVEIKIESFLDSHSWVEKDYKKVTVVFLCAIASGKPKALSETGEVRWATLEEIEKLNLAPHILRLIKKAAGKINI